MSERTRARLMDAINEMLNGVSPSAAEIVDALDAYIDARDAPTNPPGCICPWYEPGGRVTNVTCPVHCPTVAPPHEQQNEPSSSPSRDPGDEPAEPTQVLVVGEWDESCPHDDCSHTGAEGRGDTMPAGIDGRPRWPLIWTCDGCGTLMARDLAGKLVPVRARLRAEREPRT